MYKLVDARPLLTTYVGVALLLYAASILGMRQSEAMAQLYRAVRHEHQVRGLAFEPQAYAGRCIQDVGCLGAYATSGWQTANAFERSTVVPLVLSLALLVVGKVWNPALQASNRTQSRGLEMNAVPARAASKPGWLPWG